MKSTKQVVFDILRRAPRALTTAEINERYQRRALNGTAPEASYDAVRGRTYELVDAEKVIQLTGYRPHKYVDVIDGQVMR